MNPPNARILAFDSWAGGSYNLERLLPALSERGMTFSLLHIGSWGNDRGRPKQERIGALDVRDISYYGEKAFDEILDLEKPDAVVMLSTQTFAHRAFLRYCKQRAIPTLHIYHGVVNVQVNTDQRGSHKIDHVAYAKYVASRLSKLIRLTFPCYIASLIRTRAKYSEWTRFFSDVVSMALGLPTLIAAEDAGTCKCAVYTNADIEHAVRVYGFNVNDVAAVGNPDLIRFGFTSQLLGIRIGNNDSHLNTVMYIDTALALVGLLFKNQDSFIEHLKATSEQLAAQGMKLIFKPHPAHDFEYLKARLGGIGVELVSGNDFLTKLLECRACIAETTSAALIPALMGVPLLYASYGELKEQRFGPVLKSYPRGYILEDVSHVSDILSTDAKSSDSKAVNAWIAFNSGPLPADEMPRRVAALVQSLIFERQVGEPERAQ